MEQTLFLFFAVILIFLIGLIAYLVYFGQRFLKLQENKNQEKAMDNKELTLDELVKSGKLSPELAKIVNETEQRSNSQAKICVDHPDTPSFKTCSISGEHLCANCITKQKDIWVGKKYLDLFLEANWDELIMLPNNEENLSSIQEILKKKQDLWSGQSLPIIIQGHYKINVETDNIESFTVVLVRPEDKEKVQNTLSFYH